MQLSKTQNEIALMWQIQYVPPAIHADLSTFPTTQIMSAAATMPLTKTRGMYNGTAVNLSVDSLQWL